MVYSLSEEPSPSQPLYSKIQKIFVKTGQNDESQRELRLTVDLTSSLSKVSKQVLNIQITDDEDPYFLFSLVITEEDYQQLKQLQGLLVDFINFPSQVIRLLEQCSCTDSDAPRFLLFLEEEKRSLDILSEGPKTLLKVVETNNFKHLCHLVLNIERGSDDDIKKLMLRKIKLLKEKVIKGEKCISTLESQLQFQTNHVEEKQRELTKLQQQWNEERVLFKTESSKELSEETERLRQLQSEWKTKVEKEWAETEQKLNNQLKEAESELSKLKLENQLLLEKHAHAELTIKEQTKRIDGLEKDLTTAKWDLSSLRKQSTKLDCDYHEKEKMVNSLRTKLAVAEQELKDKLILMNKQQELLTVATEQKLRLEEALGEKEKNILRKQTSLQNISDELVKANEIITKLQKELAVVTSKLKVRTGIALEQEKVVESSKQKITELEQVISIKEKALETLSGSECDLKKTIEDLNHTLKIKDKTIEDNERVISWLNKRINDQYKANPSPCLNLTPAASTPYSQDLGRIPFGLNATSAPSNIIRLDQFQPATPPVLPPPEPPTTTVAVDDPQKQRESPVTSRVAVTTSQNTKSVVTKPSSGKPPISSKAPSVGFKRTTAINQGNAPSAYFLK